MSLDSDQQPSTDVETINLLSINRRNFAFSRNVLQSSSSSGIFSSRGNSISSVNVVGNNQQSPIKEFQSEIEDCEEVFSPGSIDKIEGFTPRQLIGLANQKNWGKLEQILKRYKNNSFQRLLSSGQKRLKKAHFQIKIPTIRCESSRETLLMLACKDNKITIAQALIELGCEINEVSKINASALHYASLYGKEDLVKLLLSHGADPKIAGFVDNDLPLHSACRRKIHAQNIVSVLCKFYPDAKLIENRSGALPIHLAAMNSNSLVVCQLLSSQTEAQINARMKMKNNDTVLHICAEQTDPESMKILLNNQADCNLKNNMDMTPLHISCQLGDLFCVKLLYHTKADASIKNSLGRTCLFLAAENGHTNVVEFVIEKFTHNCDILSRDNNGNSLIHIASSMGHPETTLALLKKGVPLHTPNREGCVCLHTACEKGHLAVVKTLLARGADVNSRNKAGYSPLHVAVLNIQPAIVEILLGSKAQVNTRTSKDGKTPLHIAASIRKGEKSAEMLIKSGAKIDEPMENGETALHLAARNANIKMVETLFNENADITRVCKAGNTVLQIAVRYCHYAVVKAFIDYAKQKLKSADFLDFLNHQNQEGETAMHFAAEITSSKVHCVFEDIDIIKMLLKHGGDINLQTFLTKETPIHYCARAGNENVLLEIVKFSQHRILLSINKRAKNGWSPLLYAADHGHLEIVKILLKHQARVDIFDDNGMTGLHVSAEKGHSKVIEILLHNKAFINARTKSGKTPLHLAAQSGFNDLVMKLIDTYKAKANAITLNQRSALHLAAMNGRLEVCKVLITNPDWNIDVSASDNFGQTALHLAAANDHAHIIRLFINFKPEIVSRPSMNGMTPLHVAADNGSKSVVEELVRFNRSSIATMKNKTNGSLPMHLASAGGHNELVKLLLNFGTPVNVENDEGETGLYLAAKSGHVEVLQVFKDHPNANLLISNSITGLTALHVAALNGQIQFVREMLSVVPANLLSEKTNDTNSEYGLTALHLASKEGQENIVRLLLNDENVDVMMATSKMLAIHFASQNGHTNVVSLLLSQSVNQINMKDGKGRTALHLAAFGGHIEMVSFLLSQAANINLHDMIFSYTALHYAAKYGHFNVCQALINSGAKPDSKTKNQETALHLAVEKKHHKLASYLLEQEHSTTALLIDNKFLLNLLECAKLTEFQIIIEFIMNSECPIDTAAKLAGTFGEMVNREREHALELKNASTNCEKIVNDLLRIIAAKDENIISKLLVAFDSHNARFIDTLVEANLKKVVASPIIQSYLTKVWYGSLEHWSSLQFTFFFLSLILFPPLWLIISLPFKIFTKFNQSPVIKFMCYSLSYCTVIVFMIITSVNPLVPLCQRADLIPTWNEWILLIWVGGMLVAELVNPSSVGGLMMLKYLFFVMIIASTWIHIFAYTLTNRIYMLELLFIRDILISIGAFSALVSMIEFLSIISFFGPFSIMILSVFRDVGRFSSVFIAFWVGNSGILRSIIEPTGGIIPRADLPLWRMLEATFFAPYGLVSFSDMLLPWSPSFAPTVMEIVYAFNLFLINIVIINILIAMMAETYKDLRVVSETEWKFSRAKIINNIVNSVPTPSPLIFFSEASVVLHKFYNLCLHQSAFADRGMNNTENRIEKLMEWVGFKEKYEETKTDLLNIEEDESND